MKRIIRFTETNVTDIAVDCENEEDAIKIAQALNANVGIDASNTVASCIFEDITESTANNLYNKIDLYLDETDLEF